MILNLLATLLLSQTPGIPAYSIPPSQERVIVFSDRGRVYIVGIETNTVKYLDDTTPPTPTPPAPVNNLTGQAKAFYDLVASAVPDQANRQLGAKGLIDAIDAAVAQIGGLGLSLEQAVTTLASYSANNAVNRFWAGVKMGDFLDSQQVTTVEQLTTTLAQIRKACEVLAK